MKLVYIATRVEVKLGDVCETFRGEKVIVKRIDAPRHAGSTGRVMVEFKATQEEATYYPGVIGAEWSE